MRLELKVPVIFLLLSLIAATARGAERQPAPPTFIMPSLVIAEAVSAGEPLLAIGKISESAKTGLVVASDRTISLYTPDQRNALHKTASWALDSAVGAVVTADLDGDATDEIVTATADDGILEVQRLRRDERIVLGDRRYLWSPVLSMVSARTLDGTLVVISSRGGPVFTYGWGGGAIEPLAVSSDPRLRNLNLRAVGDLDGDEQDEIVATSGFSQLVVLRYAKGEWSIAWQNFPWGGISGVSVVDALGTGRPQIIVATHERLAYLFEHTKSGFVLAKQISDLPFGVVEVVTAASQRGERIAFVTRTGVLVRREPPGTTEWRGFDTVTTARLLWPENDPRPVAGPVMVATDTNRSLVLYSMVDASRWKVVVNLGAGQVKPIREMTTGQGHLLVSLREVADLLGARLTWDQESRLATLTWTDQSLEFASLTGAVIRNGEQLNDVAPPQIVNGKLYMPVLALDRLFGWRTFVNVEKSLIEVTL